MIALSKKQAVLEDYFKAMAEIPGLISKPDVEKAIGILFEAWERGDTVYAMGNGGSASTATHFASDLAKYTIVDGKSRFKVMSLGDNIPLMSAWTNDSGFGSVFSEQLDPWLKKGDVLVGFSVHGGSGHGDAGPWSQNLGRAIQLAKQRGARTIGFAGFDGGAMKKLCDVCVVIPIDTEPLGTPLVESFHVMLHHLICVVLKSRIAEYA